MKKKPTTKKEIKQRKWRKRHSSGEFVLGVRVPKGAIPAKVEDQDQSVSSLGPLYYRDIEFRCFSCLKQCVWTAAQQKRYFEDQKGNIYNKPKRCTPCHRKRMAARQRP